MDIGAVVITTGIKKIDQSQHHHRTDIALHFSLYHQHQTQQTHQRLKITY